MTEERVIVVGGGIAGLAAASKLGAAGIPVLLLEARSRLGGRIFTRRLSDFDASVELGAEFIHGLPPEILGPLQKAKAEFIELDGQNWCVSDQGITRCDAFSQIDSILDKMDDRSPDESFLDFLERRFPNPGNDPNLNEAKQRALGYIIGFEAADPAEVGVHWLVQSMRAEDEIQGHRAFRPSHGYQDLVEAFRREITGADVTVRTDTVVQNIDWKPGEADVTVHSVEGTSLLRSSCVLVTLPLAVLRAPAPQLGAIQFAPALPAEKIASFAKLEMGKVIRVVLHFRQRFWDTISDGKQSLSEMSFLFTRDEWFPTWWTTMPKKEPLITGWAPFRAAERLFGKENGFVTEQALRSLSRTLGVSLRNLENWLDHAYFHDWQSDPFSRGAYSYGKVGSTGAQHVLGTPVENTLFFAGEATDTSGHNGTVHGAIASGYRAAGEIIRAQVS